MNKPRPCVVQFVADALGVRPEDILQAVRDDQLMACGGRSPAKAKVLGPDALHLYARPGDLCPLCGGPIPEPEGD